MAKLYVIGGAPRCGKTSILRVFKERFGEPLAALSTDDMLNDLWREHDDDRDQYPELMQQVIDNENGMPEAEWIAFQAHTDYLVHRQHAQSRAVWKMRLGARIIDHLVEPNAPPLLAEGIALLPDLIAPLAQIAELNAVYIGNESPNHADALIDAARSVPSPQENWMHGLSDEQIRAYMKPKEAMSHRIRVLAARHGFPYIDMGQGNFSANIARVVGTLTTNEL